MSKNRRGKGLVSLPNNGRGECPICKRTAIKLVWEWKDKDGKEINVCKNCRAKDPQKVEL